METFGERLQELREDKNLSILQLSKELKVSDTTVARWEKNIHEITAENLLIVAKYFNVSCDYLLGLDNNF